MASLYNYTRTDCCSRASTIWSLLRPWNSLPAGELPGLDGLGATHSWISFQWLPDWGDPDPIRDEHLSAGDRSRYSNSNSRRLAEIIRLMFLLFSSFLYFCLFVSFLFVFSVPLCSSLFLSVPLCSSLFLCVLFYFSLFLSISLYFFWFLSVPFCPSLSSSFLFSLLLLFDLCCVSQSK